MQQWLQHIDNPNTCLKKDQELNLTEKTEKIKIISDVVITKNNEVYDFNDEAIIEGHHQIKKRKLHSEVSVLLKKKCCYVYVLV